MASQCTWSFHCRNDPGNSAFCSDHRCLADNCPAPLQQDATHSYHSLDLAPAGQYCGYHTCPEPGCAEPRIDRPHKDRVPDPNDLKADREYDLLRHCELHQCRAGIKSGGLECNFSIEGVLLGTPYCTRHRDRGLAGMSEPSSL
ncbi:hypothetical protein E8E14_011159 [Neopestalotiopsis sp. 37M]|nr:hypothetical protein E8E14_011159 [Neopestalotiopsis sp. 37M]